MVTWGDFKPIGKKFDPNSPATRSTLYDWLKRLGLPESKSLADNGGSPLLRAEAVQHLWRALRLKGEWFPVAGQWLKPDGDDDGDGRPDYDDPLPFDSDNNNVPDRLEPKKAGRS